MITPEAIAGIMDGRYIYKDEEIEYVMDSSDIECCKNCKSFEPNDWYGELKYSFHERFSGDCGFPSVNLPFAFAIESTFTDGFHGICCPCWEEKENEPD